MKGGAILPEAQNEFRSSSWTPRPNERCLVFTGANPPAEAIQRLKWTLKYYIRKRRHPKDVLRLLVDFVRRCADESDLVGRSLVSVYLPVQAQPTVVRIGRGQQFSSSMCTTDTSGKPISLMFGGSLEKAAAFHYWPAGQNTAAWCGPNVATRGTELSYLMSLISGSLAPIARNGR
jgi:hypothetical protein